MNPSMQTRKRNTNISLDSALVEEAKQLKINLSATLNSALADIVKAQQQAKWREENKTAITAMNRFAEEHAIPRSSEGLRVFK